MDLRRLQATAYRNNLCLTAWFAGLIGKAKLNNDLNEKVVFNDTNSWKKKIHGASSQSGIVLILSCIYGARLNTRAGLGIAKANKSSFIGVRIFNSVNGLNLDLLD